MPGYLGHTVPDSEDGPSFARVSSLASRLDDRLWRIVARTRFVTRGGTYRRKFPDLKHKKTSTPMATNNRHLGRGGNDKYRYLVFILFFLLVLRGIIIGFFI